MNQVLTINERKLNASIEIIDKICAVGLSAMDKFPSAEYSTETFTFISYLERFTLNLGSINLLLNNFKEHPYVETSIGLTVRAGLLDCMTITYLFSYKADIKSDTDKNGIDVFNKQFDIIISDQIHNSFKYLKVAKDNGVLTMSEYQETLENIYYSYGFLFIDDKVDYAKPERKLRATEAKSPKQLFVRIKNHPHVKDYAMVYDLYTYYSKYEHFGIMTHFMQREDLNNDLERIYGCIKYMIIAMGTTLMLAQPDSQTPNEFLELQKLLYDFLALE